MEPSERVRRAVTAGIERKILVYLAERTPRRIHPDHLTILGVVGAIGTFAGYALSARNTAWLWLASAMLALNWVGDSLDGNVARVRGLERPRYGYYLDHAVDAFTTVAIGLGIGLSPFVSVYAGLGIAIMYLVMSVNVYLESKVFSEFRLDYSALGPTEVRILLILLNTVAFWGVASGRATPGDIAPVATVAVYVGLGIMGLLLLRRFAGNLRRLGREDPSRPG